MQHTFGVRELIRAGLQDLDRARELLQELQENGLGEKILALKGRQEILKEIQEGYQPIYPEEKSV